MAGKSPAAARRHSRDNGRVLCGLTFELTRVRKRAKPDVALRVQRRVRRPRAAKERGQQMCLSNRRESALAAGDLLAPPRPRLQATICRTEAFVLADDRV